MNNYNPILDYQRNNLLVQQQMIQNQLNSLNAQRQQTFNPYPNSQMNDTFFIRQVGSLEEVKGYPVEPQKIYLFPDTGTGDIYLKRLNTDNGKSEIITYRPLSTDKPESKPEVKNSPEQRTELDMRLDKIEKKLGDVYESISNFKVYAEPTRNHATADVAKNAPVESSEVRPGNEND